MIKSLDFYSINKCVNTKKMQEVIAYKNIKNLRYGGFIMSNNDKIKSRPATNDKPKKVKKPIAKPFIANKVPLKACYKECGIIESAPGQFSVAYKVHINDKYDDKSMEELRNGLRNILSHLASKKFSYQIFIQNSIIQIGDFLENIQLKDNKSKEINECIYKYNQMLKNNAEIGHNNFERTIAFVLSCRADVVDDAIVKFEEINQELITMFKEQYGYLIERETIEERLETLYSLFHPDDVTGSYAAKREQVGNIKSAICPDTYEFRNTDYIKIGEQYARVLFVNSIPSVVSNTLLNDLMATASNSVMSIFCTPMDTDLAYKLAKKQVEANTDRKQVYIRNTVEDRKHKRSETKIERLHETEREYFYEQASEILEKTIANNDVMLMTNFLFTIFANSKEELDRNTKLISMSASKFAVQIRVCEDFQDEAFQSMFPVCNVKVDTARFLPSSTIATMQPLRAKVVVSNKYSFSGLNSVSDNLVFINRDLCRSGLISGTGHSGKSFAVKREALNKLMNSDNDVLIITPSMKPYTKFVDKLNGEKFTSEHVNFFLLSKDENVKRYMFEAFIVNALNVYDVGISNSKRREIIDAIKKEAEKLSKFKTWNEAMSVYNEHRDQFEKFGLALKTSKYTVDFKGEATYLNSTNRLNIVETKSNADLIIAMATAIEFKNRREAAGKNVDIFIDGIDPVFYNGGDFAACLADIFEDSNSYLTMVVQDAVRVLNNVDASIEFSFFIDHIGYFKLLKQGPIERRFYSEKLNIPTSLLAYLTDNEPGEGVIITRAENVAFNDRFENKTDPFYELFYI